MVNIFILHSIIDCFIYLYYIEENAIVFIPKEEWMEVIKALFTMKITMERTDSFTNEDIDAVTHEWTRDVDNGVLCLTDDMKFNYLYKIREAKIGVEIKEGDWLQINERLEELKSLTDVRKKYDINVDVNGLVPINSSSMNGCNDGQGVHDTVEINGVQNDTGNLGEVVTSYLDKVIDQNIGVQIENNGRSQVDLKDIVNEKANFVNSRVEGAGFLTGGVAEADDIDDFMKMVRYMYGFLYAQGYVYVCTCTFI
jgi:hypothetical protein